MRDEILESDPDSTRPDPGWSRQGYGGPETIYLIVSTVGQINEPMTW